jgi:hypothetical protein
MIMMALFACRPPTTTHTAVPQKHGFGQHRVVLDRLRARLGEVGQLRQRRFGGGGGRGRRGR